MTNWTCLECGEFNGTEFETCDRCHREDIAERADAATVAPHTASQMLHIQCDTDGTFNMVLGGMAWAWGLAEDAKRRTDVPCIVDGEAMVRELVPELIQVLNVVPSSRACGWDVWDGGR